MKDPRRVMWVLLLTVLLFRPHLSGGTYPFTQELLLIPLLLGIGITLLSSSGASVGRKGTMALLLPWMLLCWSGLSLLWSSDPGQGMRDVAALALNVSAFTSVYILAIDPGRVEKGFAWVCGLVVLPVTASAVYQRVFGMGEIREILEGMSSAGEDVSGLLGTISEGRVFAGFLNSNMLAGFLALSIPVILDLAITTSDRRWKNIYSSFLVLTGGALVLTGSMGGAMAALLGAGGVVLARKGMGRREIIPFLVLLAVTGTMLIVIRGTGSFIGSESSFVQRAGYMAAGIKMAIVHPFLGWGAGSSPGALMGYVSEGVRPVSDPHNFLVRSWIETGVVGLILLGVFLLFLGSGVIHKVRSESLKLAAPGYVGFLFAVLAFLFHSLMDMDFFVPETALFGWCGMGVLLALSTGSDPDREKQQLPTSFMQAVGGMALFAVLPALVLLQGESVAFRAMKTYQAGQYMEAAALYEEAAKLMPFNGRISLEEGRARFASGEPSRALGLFKKAARLMSASPYPAWELGRMAQARARWTESLPYLEKALDRYPTSPRILIDLARSQINTGEQDLARQNLERAIAVSMYDPEAGKLAKELKERVR